MWEQLYGNIVCAKFDYQKKNNKKIDSIQVTVTKKDSQKMGLEYSKMSAVAKDDIDMKFDDIEIIEGNKNQIILGSYYNYDFNFYTKEA